MRSRAQPWRPLCLVAVHAGVLRARRRRSPCGPRHRVFSTQPAAGGGVVICVGGGAEPRSDEDSRYGRRLRHCVAPGWGGLRRPRGSQVDTARATGSRRKAYCCVLAPHRGRGRFPSRARGPCSRSSDECLPLPAHVRAGRRDYARSIHSAHALASGGGATVGIDGARIDRRLRMRVRRSVDLQSTVSSRNGCLAGAVSS